MVALFYRAIYSNNALNISIFAKRPQYFYIMHAWAKTNNMERDILNVK